MLRSLFTGFPVVFSFFKDTRYVFVADFFAQDLTGGAELTSEALFESCPDKIEKIHSASVNESLILKNLDKIWIFGNFANLQRQLLPLFIEKTKYFVLEYDYKYCAFRSPEKHALNDGSCKCEYSPWGKLIERFYANSLTTFWMSALQLHHYQSKFQNLNADNVVLSSVFSDETLNKLKELRASIKQKNDMWLVLGSDSWVKGTQAAVDWCLKNSKQYEIVANLKYEDMLKKIASSHGLVYLPAGGDTCPRLVIEAKLLNCQLQLNDNVQHRNEEWFCHQNVKLIEEYLINSKERFWGQIKNVITK